MGLKMIIDTSNWYQYNPTQYLTDNKYYLRIIVFDGDSFCHGQVLVNGYNEERGWDIEINPSNNIFYGGCKIPMPFQFEWQENWKFKPVDQLTTEEREYFLEQDILWR